ncbi:protein FAM117B-like [Lutra lutra]|uniref:protein FAM117B-like n=1 Tax=Lutra lutra TaxID=9657 RepID=UPI001FD343FF|nr:protein FAM117B-like [Lutra lutra]
MAGPRGADAPRLSGGSAQAAAGRERGRAGRGGDAGRGGAPQARAARGGLAITALRAASRRERSACPGSSGSPPQPPGRPVMLPPLLPPPPPPCALWEREEAALRRYPRGCPRRSPAHAASPRRLARSILHLTACAAAAEAPKPAPDLSSAAQLPRGRVTPRTPLSPKRALNCAVQPSHREAR